MDVYVSAVLGFPIMLSDEDFDQDLPLEVDDEYVTTKEILPMPIGKVSFIAATNAHTRLLKILQKVAKYIYPLKGLGKVSSKTNQSYVVNHARIREIERDLQAWMEDLPTAFRPSDDVPTELARSVVIILLALLLAN